MKTKAAVAIAARKPLEIITVDLDGPKAGEVLVEIKASGVCHTDEFTRSGADPEGLFPAILGHEGAGIVVDVGPGRDLGAQGRSCDSALHARVPAVQVLHVAQDQSVHRDPRHPGQGTDAGRHQPLFHRQGSGAPLHGLLDVLEFHGAAGDRGGENPRGCALRQGVLHRLRRDHGHRRGDQYGQGRGGRQCGGVRSGRHRSECGAGRAHGRRQQDHRRGFESGAQGAGGEIRPDAFRESEGGRTAIWSRTWWRSPTAARTTASNASATSISCARHWSAAIAAGACR